jgi:hypothetical protein
MTCQTGLPTTLTEFMVPATIVCMGVIPNTIRVCWWITITLTLQPSYFNGFFPGTRDVWPPRLPTTYDLWDDPASNTAALVDSNKIDGYWWLLPGNTWLNTALLFRLKPVRSLAILLGPHCPMNSWDSLLTALYGGFLKYGYPQINHL